MKIKEFFKCLFIRKVYTTALSLFGILGTVSGLACMFNIEESIKLTLFIISIVSPVITWIVFAICIYKKRSVFIIEGNTVYIEKGDIFSHVGNDNFLTVINMDNRFNTKVDNVVISKNSIHGQYINKYYNDNIESLECLISKGIEKLNKLDKKIGDESKKTCVELGSYIYDYNYSTMLFAFSELDENYKARLNYKEYRDVLFKLWDGIDNTYAGRDIYIPLLGNGIVRICDINKSPTDLLQIILSTIKLSGLKLHSHSSLHIVIRDKDYNNIDFIKLIKTLS